MKQQKPFLTKMHLQKVGKIFKLEFLATFQKRDSKTGAKVYLLAIRRTVFH